MWRRSSKDFLSIRLFFCDVCKVYICKTIIKSLRVNETKSWRVREMESGCLRQFPVPRKRYKWTSHYFLYLCRICFVMLRIFSIKVQFILEFWELKWFFTVFTNFATLKLSLQNKLSNSLNWWDYHLWQSSKKTRLIQFLLILFCIFTSFAIFCDHCLFLTLSCHECISLSYINSTL